MRDPPRTGRQKLAHVLAMRPRVGVEILALLASVFFALASNGAFWHATRAAGTFEGPHGALGTTSIFIVLVCMQLIVLCVVLQRVTVKALLTFLLVAAAVISHVASANGAYLEPEAMRALLQSNLLASTQLLSWDFVRVLALEAAVPALLLWRVQITRVRWPEAVARRVMTMVFASACLMTAVRLPNQDITHLMRDHKALRYLMTPSNLAAVRFASVPASLDAPLPPPPR